jgi:hypothetical protein
MAMRKRTRTKGIAKSRAILGPDVEILGYGVGVTGMDPRRTIGIILAAEVAIVVSTTLAFHRPFVPGILIIVLIRAALNRPVAIVRLPKGFVLMNRSNFTGQPVGHIGTLSFDAFEEPSSQSVGNYRHNSAANLWISKSELGHLQAATSTM